MSSHSSISQMGQVETNQDPLREEAIQRVRDELKAKDPNFKDELHRLPDELDKLKILLTMQRIFWNEPTTKDNLAKRVREFREALNGNIFVAISADTIYYSIPADYVCQFNAFGVKYLIFK